MKAASLVTEMAIGFTGSPIIEFYVTLPSDSYKYYIGRIAYINDGEEFVWSIHEPSDEHPYAVAGKDSIHRTGTMRNTESNRMSIISRFYNLFTI